MTAPYPSLLSHILDGELYGPLLVGPEAASHRRAWRKLFAELAARPPLDHDVSRRFHVKWHESHHFMRQLVADDALMLDVARAWLPPYSGGPLLLHRGENLDRLLNGEIGSAWSDQEETAAMFARGLNAVGGGGVLLRSIVPAEAIIAGPSDHSANWLREREFTVDHRRLMAFERICTYPPAFV